MHQINPSTSPYPLILTYATATDLSREDVSLPDISYDDIPHKDHAKSDDLQLEKVQKWLEDLIRPDDLSDTEYITFMRYCTDFFVDDGRLWRKNSHSAHNLVAPPETCLDIMRTGHADIRHKLF